MWNSKNRIGAEGLPGQLLTRWPRSSRRPRNILGLASTGHGASLAYAGADGLIRATVLDRWVGEKHVLLFSADEDRDIRNPQSEIDKGIWRILAYGFGRFPTTRVFEEIIDDWVVWFLSDLGLKARDIDLVVASDSHFALCPLRLGSRLNEWFPAAAVFTGIEHHAIHQRQAFWQSGFEEAAVLTLDTCGEELERLGGRKLCGTISRMDAKGRCDELAHFFFPDQSIGYLYDAVTHHVGFVQGDEGKTMGLAPYGNSEFFDEIFPHLFLRDDGTFDFMPFDEFTARMKNYVPERESRAEITPRHENVAYAVQKITELTVTNAFRAAQRLTGLKKVAYAGGVALNSVANQAAWVSTQPEELYIATNPGDTGHALGCALFGAHELAGWPPLLKEVPEYLGPNYEPAVMEAAARAAGGPMLRPLDAETRLARCIAQGYITARFSGRSEFGPRALGNRSILCDPRRPDMKAHVNARVKHREGFRPFAPAVLEEHTTAWFELDERSPYMLRVVPLRQERRGLVPAIVHVDGTARTQTVNRLENPGLHGVISEFYRMTAVPMVLNTSFNVAGKPIVETPEDAVRCFLSTEIDVLGLGPFILSKRPLEEYESRERLGAIPVPRV